MKVLGNGSTYAAAWVTVFFRTYYLVKGCLFHVRIIISDSSYCGGSL